MNHDAEICQLIQSVVKSRKYHAVIISGPPGFGKTTSVNRALAKSKVKVAKLGAYSTPLGFFNFLHANADKVVVIDDTSGLYGDPSSMALLKAATWSQAGARIIRWDTLSTRAAAEEFLFSGKFVIICNTFPNTADGEAVKSRSFLRPIEISGDEARCMILKAAEDQSRYKDSDTAAVVARFLVSRLNDNSVGKISYRTLEKGYDLAIDHPENWKDLLIHEIPKTINPERLVVELDKQQIKVKEQLRIFERTTGLKRRSFFKYRSQANLGGSSD